MLAISSLIALVFGGTLSRAFVFMPKGPTLAFVFEAITSLGRLAEWMAIVTSLLVYLSLLLSSANPIRIRLVLLVFLALQTVPIFFSKELLLLGLYHLTLPAAALIIVFSGTLGFKKRLFLSLAALAMLAASLSFSVNLFNQGGFLSLSPGLAHSLFRGGEVFAVAAGLAAPLAFGVRRTLTSPLLLIPVALAVTFFLAREHSPGSAYTGLLIIWATGFTLFLPSWLYSLSIFGFFSALTASLQSRAALSEKMALTGLTLLLAARYSPQEISHSLLALLAVWLLGKHSLGKTFAGGPL